MVTALPPVCTASNFVRHVGRAASRVTVTASATSSALADWATQDRRRMLHAVYRVLDMDRSVEYYTKQLGMKVLREQHLPEMQYKLITVGYGPEEENFALELAYNYGDQAERYDIGDGFGHFGLAAPDVYQLVANIKEAGGKVSREAGPVVPGSNVIIAFVEDPTGYQLELIQRRGSTEPLCQVMLRVMDLEKSIKFYTEVLGMELLQRLEIPRFRYTLAFMGYGPEESNTVFELTYEWDRTEPYSKGDAFGQVAISTDDVYISAEAIRAAGGTITKEPGPHPYTGAKMVQTIDPDGWKILLMDHADLVKEVSEARRLENNPIS